MTEQTIETAIAALKKYYESAENTGTDDPLPHFSRCLTDTYHLLSQLIIEGYDFKPNVLDDPVFLRKFPDFIPRRIPAMWQTLSCQGSHYTNTLCPDIQAIINKAIGIRRPATASNPEYCRCDQRAQIIAKRAFEASLRVLWFFRKYLEGGYLVLDKDANPFELNVIYNNSSYGCESHDNSDFLAPHSINYWQGQIDALLEDLPSRPLENPADVERFKKIIEIAKALKLTPGSKPTVDLGWGVDKNYEIKGSLPLSALFESLGGLENSTIEDILVALKALCPDIHDWDIIVGSIHRPAFNPCETSS